MKKVVSLFALATCLWQCSSEKPTEKAVILDIQTIAAKTPEQVIEVLGEPDSAYVQYVTSIEIYTQLYKKYDLEIQYLPPAKLAKDIIFRSTDFLKIPYDTMMLEQFGIKPCKPTEQRDKFYMKWYDYAGLRTINLYATSKDENGVPNKHQLFFKVP